MTTKTTQYHKDTLPAVIAILDQLYKSKERCRLYYGDIATGLSWMEEHNIHGTISRSTGTQPIPILINNSRSYGGGHILDHCITRIDVKGRTLYKHPYFHLPKLIQVDNTIYLSGGARMLSLKIVLRQHDGLNLSVVSSSDGNYLYLN